MGVTPAVNLASVFQYIDACQKALGKRFPTWRFQRYANFTKETSAVQIFERREDQETAILWIHFSPVSGPGHHPVIYQVTCTDIRREGACEFFVNAKTLGSLCEDAERLAQVIADFVTNKPFEEVTEHLATLDPSIQPQFQGESPLSAATTARSEVEAVELAGGSAN